MTRRELLATTSDLIRIHVQHPAAQISLHAAGYDAHTLGSRIERAPGCYILIAATLRRTYAGGA